MATGQRDYEHDTWIAWYVEDTAGWLALSLAARGAMAEVARKLNRKGELTLRRGLSSLAVILRLRWEGELEPAIAELLEAGKILWDESRSLLFDPDYVARRRSSSADRMREKRARDARAPSDARDVTSVTTVTVTPVLVSSLSSADRDQDPEITGPPDGSTGVEWPDDAPSAIRVSPRPVTLVPPAAADPPRLPDGAAHDRERPPAAGAPEGILEPPPRTKRDFGIRRFEESFLTQAFKEGALEVPGVAGCAIARKELGALDDALDEFGPGGDLAVRVDWVRASVKAFRTAIVGREQFHGQGGPGGWLEWLNTGARDARWLNMTPKEREADALEAARRKKGRAREDARRELARTTPPEPLERISPEAASAALRAIGLG